MARIILLLALAWPLAAPAQDSFQLARLEQDVRQLQREVQVLTQLVDQLRARADAPGPLPPAQPILPRQSPFPAPPRTDESLPRWVDAARWRGIRPGMSELEVVGELGPPTSTRVEDPQRTLLYALEIGPGAFLAGSVTLRDHAVTSVEIPVLK
ncbi:MAG: hypothetical protein DIU62_006815 [Pseudomonadota bacterium]|jgi:hypothetical protein|nr:MAG: hypothetical protein DIU62_03180 [Pseudomonadota bacterium]